MEITTIKERAQNYANSLLVHESTDSFTAEGLRKRFTAIVIEQRDIDCQKTCKWLEDNLDYYVKKDGSIDYYCLLEELKKYLQTD